MAGERYQATDNRLIGAMDPADRDRLTGIALRIDLDVKTVLFEPGKPLEAVYFPLDGVVSLVTPLEDGSIVEVATIGNEGVVGVPLIAGGTLAVRAICQVRGVGLLVPAGAFLAELARNGSLREVYDRYVPALFGQIAQAAACNRLHTNEERLSRWLLMSRDRVGVNEFSITHEFLGQMLGSRRATVTLSAGILQAAGLIRYHRGHLTIIDREGLEEVACECYAAIKAELDGALAPLRSANGHSPSLN
ncbi:MAG TPA: Crp/Fnr family transcriptional regulator [Candidatus Deferrimicrobium sp.]|nr:Crp/Fnr family transcriptional regulator [Candidatus Deferrimicrobium sp.]